MPKTASTKEKGCHTCIASNGYLKTKIYIQGAFQKYLVNTIILQSIVLVPYTCDSDMTSSEIFRKIFVKANWIFSMDDKRVPFTATLIRSNKKKLRRLRDYGGIEQR